MTGLEIEVKDCKIEMKDLDTKIFQKTDILGSKIESSHKEMVHDQQKQLASILNDRRKEFDKFWACHFFIVNLTLHIIYQFLTRSRLWVSRRC